MEYDWDMRKEDVINYIVEFINPLNNTIKCSITVNDKELIVTDKKSGKTIAYGKTNRDSITITDYDKFLLTKNVLSNIIEEIRNTNRFTRVKIKSDNSLGNFWFFQEFGKIECSINTSTTYAEKSRVQFSKKKNETIWHIEECLEHYKSCKKHSMHITTAGNDLYTIEL